LVSLPLVRLGMIGVSLATAVIALPASTAVAGGAPVVAGGKQTHEVDTWAASPADIGGVYSDTTVRNIVHTNIGGSGLRVRLSNAFGSNPATFDDVQVGRQSSGRPPSPDPTVGSPSVARPASPSPRAPRPSPTHCPERLPLAPNLAVSVHFTGFTGEATGHPDAQQDNYASPAGDVAGTTTPPLTSPTPTARGTSSTVLYSTLRSRPARSSHSATRSPTDIGPRSTPIAAGLMTWPGDSSHCPPLSS